jgi:hypothetical protein
MKIPKLKKRWIACITICAIIVGFATTVGILVSDVNREISGPVVTENESGTTGTMFIVFRPGISSFPQDILDKFVAGAISRNWRIDLTPVSKLTPTNVSMYQLIVLLAPVYGGKPAPQMQAYLSSVNFLGKPVVVMLTSGGENPGAEAAMRNGTTAANGVVLVLASYKTIGTADNMALAYALGANQSLIDAI